MAEQIVGVGHLTRWVLGVSGTLLTVFLIYVGTGISEQRAINARITARLDSVEGTDIEYDVIDAPNPYAGIDARLGSVEEVLREHDEILTEQAELDREINRNIARLVEDLRRRQIKTEMWHSRAHTDKRGYDDHPYQTMEE